MKYMKELLPRAIKFLLLFTVICGFFYTAAVTATAQLFFSEKANGSIIEVNGKQYGSQLLAQQYTDDVHMWGRIMNLEVSTLADENGQWMLYAKPSNLSPASEEYAALIAQRVEKIKAANPDMSQPIPVDLVTCSGSGLDPHISPAAAEYQIPRLAKANGITQQEVTEIIEKCTNGKFLGIFGEKTVNVLKVNLMLEGIL